MIEHDLLERCRAGNRDAQRELYDQTSAPIYRLLLKMTASPDDAFDLAQETYLKAFTQLGRFDGRSSLATWLYRVAVNEALQFLRRAKQTRVKLQELAAEDCAASENGRTTARLDVNNALAMLPPNDRAMLLLRYQEGLNYRSIAATIGCAEGTVASRLNRARERLRNLLQNSYEWEGSDSPMHPKDRC